MKSKGSKPLYMACYLSSPYTHICKEILNLEVNLEQSMVEYYVTQAFL